MRLSVFFAIFIMFSGCAFNKSHLKNTSSKGNEAVIAKVENYILADPTDYNKIADFNEKILKAYKKIISTGNYGDFQAGFIYKIVPKGIINPYSEVQVVCLVQNKYSGKYGEKLCNKFFKNIEEEFKQ